MKSVYPEADTSLVYTSRLTEMRLDERETCYPQKVRDARIYRMETHSSK